MSKKARMSRRKILPYRRPAPEERRPAVVVRVEHGTDDAAALAALREILRLARSLKSQTKSGDKR
jgi:hypothetical protein